MTGKRIRKIDTSEFEETVAPKPPKAINMRRLDKTRCWQCRRVIKSGWTICTPCYEKIRDGNNE